MVEAKLIGTEEGKFYNYDERIYLINPKTASYIEFMERIIKKDVKEVNEITIDGVILLGRVPNPETLPEEYREYNITKSITIKNEYASSNHALIYIPKNGPHYKIEDLNSKNGTYINGDKISKSHLKSGEKINISDTVIQFIQIKN